MKTSFFVFIMFSFSASAQPVNCQVVMLSQNNQLLKRFYGHSDWRTGMCRDAINKCKYEVHLRNLYKARCVQLKQNSQH